MTATVEVHGPAWDLSEEYAAPDAQALLEDLESLSGLLDQIESRNPDLEGTDSVAAAQSIFKLSDSANRLLRNVQTFASCLLSVDSQDDQAQALQGTLQNYSKRLDDLVEPLSQFTLLAEDEVVERYLADPEVAPSAFLVDHARRRRHERLGLAEESLVNGLSQDGIHAWGNLYDQLSGTLSCEVLVGNESQSMGVAQTTGLLMSPDEPQRRNAWRAIGDAWRGHEETCAAAINAIAGWRLEMCRKRGTQQPVHFLDAPVHMNRLERRTLDTLLAVASEARPLARRAARLQARAYGKEKYGPWDLLAPAPVVDPDGGAKIPFAEALDIIASAYGEVDGSMAEFVRKMAEHRWIEGTVGPNKRPGAYCTQFSKSRTPRVYMTYTGGGSDVITLAHELGHAYHAWVMRDLPRSQTSYGMSLAETASTFGETLVRDVLLSRAETPSQRLDIMWEDLSAFVAFVLNIPARFEFERAFYEKRSERPLRPRELNELMNAAWESCYGDSLAEPDPMFWASKLHFYISGLSFYNFPYLFGYLFSLGVYSKRQEFGNGFFEHYQALLRDTGRMTAEELARTHLSVDLTRKGFWQQSINAFEPKLDAFEELLGELGVD